MVVTSFRLSVENETQKRLCKKRTINLSLSDTIIVVSDLCYLFEHTFKKSSKIISIESCFGPSAILRCFTLPSSAISILIDIQRQAIMPTCQVDFSNAYLCKRRKQHFPKKSSCASSSVSCKAPTIFFFTLRQHQVCFNC